MLGGEVSGGCEQVVIKAFGSGWNVEILAELGFLEMEVPEAGGREEANSRASDSHREQPRAAWCQGPSPSPLPTTQPSTLLAPNCLWPPWAPAFLLGSEADAPCCLGILAEPEEGHASLWGTLIFLLWQVLDFCMPDVLKFHCVRGSRLPLLSPPRLLLLEPQAPSCLTWHVLSAPPAHTSLLLRVPCSSPSLLELISTIKSFTATCFPHGCHLPRPLTPTDCF